MADTIAALASAPGPAGVAVVRVSGPLARAIACQLSGRPLEQLPHGHLRFGPLRDFRTQETIDRGYVVALHAPHTFTGDDTAEFFVHGSPAVVTRLLEACVAGGARLAGPGEFSLRAFRNGKLDLAQAEALADLVSARSDGGRKQALQHLDGALSRRLDDLRLPLLHLLADLEARLDFAHEPGLADVDPAAVKRALETLRRDVAELRATAKAGRIRLQGARVVVCGPPNAGKSTLFNALCGADKALVHETPGTTRDLIECSTAPTGLSVTWIDTAGLRDAVDPVEQMGTQRTQEATQSADVVLWARDGSLPPMGETPTLGPDATLRIVRTKADLAPHEAWQGVPALAVSAVTGLGMPALLDAILADVKALGETATAAGVAVARERHAAALDRCLDALDRGLLAVDALPLELLCDDVRAAAEALGDITGAVAVDAVLGAVFARFCVGK
jgi:tRNA modification GTPase